MCFLWEVYFQTELLPLFFPTSEQVCKKGGKSLTTIPNTHNNPPTTPKKIVTRTKWWLQEIPSECLWCKRWPVWGYADFKSAQSSSSAFLDIAVLNRGVTRD